MPVARWWLKTWAFHPTDHRIPFFFVHFVSFVVKSDLSHITHQPITGNSLTTKVTKYTKNINY